MLLLGSQLRLVWSSSAVWARMAQLSAYWRSIIAVFVTFVLALRQLRLKILPLLIILQLTEMLTSSGMHLNLPSKKHVGLLRQLAISTGLMSMMWRFKTSLLQGKHLLPLAKWHYFSTKAERIPNYQCIKTEIQKNITDIKNKWWEEKTKLFKALLISLTCTSSSKQQRLSMSWAQIATFLSSPRIGHFWRITLSFSSDEGSTSSCSWTKKLWWQKTPFCPFHSILTPERSSLDILPTPEESNML